jgi:hypothetical protein
MHRRELLIGAGSLAAACGVWKEILAASSIGASPPSQLLFMEVLCDLVIPDGATPGARGAGVPAFLGLGLQHGLVGASDADLTALHAQLDQAAADRFLQLPPKQRHEILSALDARYVTDMNSPWAKIKKLILMGYYTSEIGASQELQYQLVPGRFDPDLPVKPGDRAWSSDWIGQGF